MSDCQSITHRVPGGRYFVKRPSGIGQQYPAAMKQKARTEYGLRLFTARKQAGLTQTALANAVGMSQSAYQEAETTGLKSTYTAQLAAACRVNPQWLATGEGSMSGDATEPRPEAEELADAIELLTKALMKTDEFTRGLVRHSLSQLGFDSSGSVNISQKIADLLVKKDEQSAAGHDFPTTGGTIGKRIGGSATQDLGGKPHGRSDRDEGPRTAKR